MVQRYKLACVRHAYKNTEDQATCTTRTRKTFYKRLGKMETAQ